MSEKEKESHKLGLSVGSNFQDTQELRKVLEQSISREEEVLTASQPVESEQNQGREPGCWEKRWKQKLRPEL